MQSLGPGDGGHGVDYEFTQPEKARIHLRSTIWSPRCDRSTIHQSTKLVGGWIFGGSSDPVREPYRVWRETFIITERERERRLLLSI